MGGGCSVTAGHIEFIFPALSAQIAIEVLNEALAPLRVVLDVIFDRLHNHAGEWFEFLTLPDCPGFGFPFLDWMNGVIGEEARRVCSLLIRLGSFGDKSESEIFLSFFCLRFKIFLSN